MDIQSPESFERVARLFRYAEVGRCVNGVTHDINNLLGAIQAYADLVSVNVETDAESRRMLSQIGGAVQKCSALILGLTAVARKEKHTVSVIDVGGFLRAVIALRQYDFRVARIALETCFDDNLPSIMGNLPQLEMALLYLLANAFDAVRETKERRVRISAKASDGKTDITVWDSGPTIPEEVQAAMFDPFFSTKGIDHVGLGLTQARSIARAHAGDLTYTPENGFVLRLPPAHI